jgi:hypothetical protein
VPDAELDATTNPGAPAGHDEGDRTATLAQACVFDWRELVQAGARDDDCNYPRPCIADGRDGPGKADGDLLRKVHDDTDCAVYAARRAEDPLAVARATMSIGIADGSIMAVIITSQPTTKAAAAAGSSVAMPGALAGIVWAMSSMVPSPDERRRVAHAAAATAARTAAVRSVPRSRHAVPTACGPCVGDTESGTVVASRPTAGSAGPGELGRECALPFVREVNAERIEL